MSSILQKMFPLRIPGETADLVTFTEDILNGKLHFLCSEGLQLLLFRQHRFNILTKLGKK